MQLFIIPNSESLDAQHRTLYHNANKTVRDGDTTCKYGVSYLKKETVPRLIKKDEGIEGKYLETNTYVTLYANNNVTIVQ